MINPIYTVFTYYWGNVRMQWREIGEQVHLTGQATHIGKMEDLGIIEGYTARHYGKDHPEGIVTGKEKTQLDSRITAN